MGTRRWKLGVEVELAAPPSSTRRDLAVALARAKGGSIRTFFHPQTEPSHVPGKPTFHNLTLGFDALDGQGRLIARCVDDLTLQTDFDRHARPLPGWYRLVGDDERLLRLVARFADAGKPLPEALDGLRKLFQTEPKAGAGGMLRVVDELGAPICIAAPLPGERHRPCEIVTPPLAEGHRERIEELLATARGLGFTIPSEAATHLHFDAAPLCSPRVIANLVNLLSAHALNLHRLVGTNPACRRLGAWPASLYALVRSSEFAGLEWEAARERLAALQLSKYCDFNLKNIAFGFPEKHTFEVRILPGYIETAPILEAADLFEGILRTVLAEPAIPPRGEADWSETRSLLERLPMAEDLRRRWLARADSNAPDTLPSEAATLLAGRAELPHARLESSGMEVEG